MSVSVTCEVICDSCKGNIEATLQGQQVICMECHDAANDEIEDLKETVSRYEKRFGRLPEEDSNHKV